MSDNIKKDRIVGIGGMPLGVDYDKLKAGLKSDSKKSAFSNFFDTLKDQQSQTPASHKDHTPPTHQE